MRKLVGFGAGLVAVGPDLLFVESRRQGYQYWRYSLPTDSLSAATQDKYFAAKFGLLADAVRVVFGENPWVEGARLDDGSLLAVFYQDSRVHKFNARGEVEWTWDNPYGDAIYSISCDGSRFWCAYPSGQCIRAFSLESREELATLGGEDQEVFSYPEQVVAQDGVLFVVEMGNRRIRIVDAETLAMTTYRTFTTTIWEYVRAEDKEFVLIGSSTEGDAAKGIYLL